MTKLTEQGAPPALSSDDLATCILDHLAACMSQVVCEVVKRHTERGSHDLCGSVGHQKFTACDADAAPVRVAALHTLAHCERRYYLEEVENFRVSDAPEYFESVVDEHLTAEEAEEHRKFELTSNRWGIVGTTDAMRRRDGEWFAYQHKRARCTQDASGRPAAWPPDALQVAAHAILLEEHLGQRVAGGRIRYGLSDTAIHVPLDHVVRTALRGFVERARVLRTAVTRPPVPANADLCQRCTIAVICRSDYEFLTYDPNRNRVKFLRHETSETCGRAVDRREVKGRRCRLVARTEDDERTVRTEGRDSAVADGDAQAGNQAFNRCAVHAVSVPQLSGAREYSSALPSNAPGVDRRLRQCRALAGPEVALGLARRVVLARVEDQLRYLIRATRRKDGQSEAVAEAAANIRSHLPALAGANDREHLRGCERSATRAYLDSLPGLMLPCTPPELMVAGRPGGPPQDRFNALLGFGYALLYGSILRAVLESGLEPSLGFYHTTPSAAHPLVLDVTELFRVAIWDVALLASINRRQWDTTADFNVMPNRVSLTESGRHKAKRLYENRLTKSWWHPVIGCSVSYARMIKLELQLLEREWAGQPGLFARVRLR